MVQPLTFPLPPAPTRTRAPVPTSRRWWRLDWREVLPWHFEDARVDVATSDEAQTFMRQHYGDIFGAAEFDGRFLANPMTEAKRRFYDEMDCFAFRVGGAMVGVFVANPSDWSTYYARSTALLPEFRERQIVSRFMRNMEAPLRSVGVERIEAEASPLNMASVRMLTALGYVVTGSSTSERWGVLLRYSKFVSEDAQDVFARQYSAAKSAPARHGRAKNSERSAS